MGHLPGARGRTLGTNRNHQRMAGKHRFFFSCSNEKPGDPAKIWATSDDMNDKKTYKTQNMVKCACFPPLIWSKLRNDITGLAPVHQLLFPQQCQAQSATFNNNLRNPQVMKNHPGSLKTAGFRTHGQCILAEVKSQCESCRPMGPNLPASFLVGSPSFETYLGCLR